MFFRSVLALGGRAGGLRGQSGTWSNAKCFAAQPCPEVNAEVRGVNGGAEDQKWRWQSELGAVRRDWT